MGICRDVLVCVSRMQHQNEVCILVFSSCSSPSFMFPYLPFPCCFSLSYQNKTESERESVHGSLLSSESDSSGCNRRRFVGFRKSTAITRRHERKCSDSGRRNCPFCFCSLHSSHGSSFCDSDEFFISASFKERRKNNGLVARYSLRMDTWEMLLITYRSRRKRNPSLFPYCISL